MNGFEKKNNPYTLQFSFVPPQFIERREITSDIVDNFIRDLPTYRGMFITGVRGSGKTVLLGDIRNRIGESKEWITVDVNPESDILKSLASCLYLIPQLKALFVEARLDFSLLGIGVHIDNASLMASTEEDAINMMLQALTKHHKKLLITIDEVTYNKDIAKFSHAMSSFASAGYDVYVLMTGLKENINAIKNESSLTFLYRAKVEELDRLNLITIKNSYKKVMKLDDDIASELAHISAGYSLAFQALGFHYWNEMCCTQDDDDVDMDVVLDELDATLSELAYDKIWSELSRNDRQILIAMSSLRQAEEPIKVDSIRKAIGMTSNTFTTYRNRLIEKGIVDGSDYGHLSFKLPRFWVFVDMMARG